MRKKELFNKISEACKKDSTTSMNIVDELGQELYTHIYKLNVIHVIIYVVCLLGAVILFNKIDHLSFISEDFYIALITSLVGITTIIGLIFFSLYIYNKDKTEMISQSKLKRTYGFYKIYDTLSFIGIFLSIFLWLMIFIVTPVEVSGSSMEYTYFEGNKVIVWHIGYEAEKGDVVIIDAEANYNFLDETEFVIKRVIATGGDKVTYNEEHKAVLVNGRVVVTGIEENEYKMMLRDKNSNTSYVESQIVPEGYCIVLGDNLTNSMDSKSVGLINCKDVLGKCILRIYPFANFGIPEKNIKK